MFCDINSTFCYTITTSTSDWSTASTSCQGLGGNLVSYTSVQQQKMVEVRRTEVLNGLGLGL
jgi:hypothetical protein